jgi:hypothetical protein
MFTLLLLGFKGLFIFTFKPKRRDILAFSPPTLYQNAKVSSDSQPVPFLIGQNYVM